MNTIFERIKLYDFDAISEDSFNYEDSVESAIEYINYQNEQKEIIGHFKSKDWKVIDENYGFYNTFSFESLYIYFGKTAFLIDVIKCWVASLLENKSLGTAVEHYRNLITFIEKTNGFNENYLDDYLVYVEEELDNKESTKKAKLYSVINFTEYYECHELPNEFMAKLNSLRHKMKKEAENRELPSSSDVMLFSKCLEDYFYAKVTPASDDYIRYCPILIWWKLTTIIPMRSGEFCRIKRNCFSPEGDKIYFRLPRTKLSKKRIQIIDRVLIPHELHELISNYIKITERFGETKTLLSTKAQTATNKKGGFSRRTFQDRYNPNAFKYILEHFYSEVISSQYGLSVEPTPEQLKEQPDLKVETSHYDIERRLRPNDTRHLALMNLQMQGFHPVEMARLAGHARIDVQFGYYDHPEFWIDSEVEKAMKNFVFKTSVEQNVYDTTDIPTLNEKLRLRAMFKSPTSSDFKSPCEVGYCSDKERRCQATNHYECEHWRISPEQWDKAEVIINERTLEKRKTIIELHSFLKNIHKLILADKFSEIEYQHSYKLAETAKKIRAEIDSIAKLQLKRFRKE